MRGEALRLEPQPEENPPINPQSKESTQDLIAERQAIHDQVLDLDQQIKETDDPKMKANLQAKRKQISSRIMEINADFVAQGIEVPPVVDQAQESDSRPEDFSQTEKDWFAQSEPPVQGEPIIPENLSETLSLESEQAEPVLDDEALLRDAEIFAKAEEAKRQEALENSIDIEKARTWAQKEAQSAKRIGRGTKKVVTTGVKGLAMGIKGTGIATATGIGILGHAARIPLFVIKKTFGVVDNLLEMLQNKLGGPVIKFLEKAFAKKEKTNKKE